MLGRSSALLTVAVGAFALTASLAPPAHAQSKLTLQQKEAALTRWVFGHNGDVTDAPLACQPTAGACVPGPTHLNFAAPVTVPAAQACIAGTASLMSCYQGAVERLQQALDAGSAALLFDAAHRTRVVAARADVTANAPAWLKTTSPDNLLVRFFEDQGMGLAALGGCSTGTEQDRYACMGTSSGPSKPTYRAAIDILDHHNDVLVNWGRTAGARRRLEQILRSASAPAASAMTSAGVFDPRLGPGLPRTDLIGKIQYLRALTGEAGDFATEQAYLDGLVAYQADPAAPAFGANLVLFGAMRAATWVEPVTGTTYVVNPSVDADMVDLLDASRTTAHLELVRGDLAAARAATELLVHLSSPRVARPFDALGAFDRFTRPLDDFLYLPFGWSDGQQHCDWFTVEDQTISVTRSYPVTTTDRIWIDDCKDPINDDCQLGVSGHWETFTTTTWVEVTTTIDLGEQVLAESIRGNYENVLDADDGDIVDVDGNGVADLDYEDSTYLTKPTIARSGIAATECLSELATVSGGYDHALTAYSLECVGDADCQDDYGGTDGRLFLPYAMAARLCPSYTASAVGVDAVHLSYDEVAGEAVSCPTPLEFVAHLADTLEDADSEFLDALDDNAGELEALLADFAFEANLLTAPVAGMYRQRADLAYFSAEPMGDCADTPAGDCVGLDVLEERLAAAADASRKGIALHRQFSRIDRTEQALDGDVAIATYAADGVGVCEACTGWCLECLSNSEDQIRALSYRRLRDAIGTYQRVRSDQLEVMWRRLDAMPTSCMVAIDEDGDGELDDAACDAAAVECTELCTYVDAAAALVAETESDMDAMVTDLDEQLAELQAIGTSPELESLVAEIAALAAATADGVAADHEAITSGIDWLGDRKGRWSVVLHETGTTLTETIEADLADLQVEASELSTAYAGWIDGYFAKLAEELALADAATDAELAVQSNIAAYCQDLAGNPAPGGCGLGVPLDDANPTAQRINGLLASDFCTVTNQAFASIAVNIADPTSPHYLDPSDPYLDWIAEVGIESCPELVTVDVGALTTQYGGSLIEQNVLGMDAALRDLEAAIVDFNSYFELMERADALFDTYLNRTLIPYTEKTATREWVADSLVCGAAVAGAIGLAIVTEGAAAPLLIKAGEVCVNRYADGHERLINGDGNISAEELHLEATYLEQAIREAEQLYTFTQKLETVLLRVADYHTQVLLYRSQLAAFQRTIAYGNTALDKLGDYDVHDDPVYLAFEDQELRDLKAQFRDFARTFQDARRTVEYDISNVLPAGAAYHRSSTATYWMPSIAEVTVASPALANPADIDTAYEFLEMVGGTVEPAAEDQSLVAAASLLLEIYADFREVYGERLDFGATGYIASSVPGLSDTDLDGLQDDLAGELLYDNPGELALLGDSRFYDPREPMGEGAADCPAGWVDVSDYCASFTSGLPTMQGDCADSSTMTVDTRLDLAHLDHMVRTPGVDTFECTIDVNGVISIAPRVGSGSSGRFTGGALGDLPWYAHDSTDWYRGHPVVDTTFYWSQTATVRALIDAFLDAVEDPSAELAPNFNFYPGTYVYQVDLTDPWLEPEVDLMTGATDAPQTMSEQLDALAVVCSGALACGATSTSVEDDKPVDLAVLGPGYKGTRCRYDAEFAAASDLEYPDSAPRQAQLQFEMDHDLAAGTVRTFKSTSPEGEPLIESALDASTLLQRPLHSSRVLIGVHGLYEQSGTADNANIWALHVGGTEPRLRLAARYSYYNTDPIYGPTDLDIGGFLACPVDSSRM